MRRRVGASVSETVLSDRSEAITAALAKAGLDNWDRQAVTGDASTRRYERLRSGAETVILMDAPGDAAGLNRFAVIATALRDAGLAAPEVLFMDLPLGLMVLEDLGREQVAAWLRHHRDDEPVIYELAVDILPRIHAAPPIPELSRLGSETGAAALGPFFDWAAPDTSEGLREDIRHHLAEAIAPHDRSEQVLALRDYHAENLIWRPNRRGTDRIGLLDFQDAVITHPAYDLASLIHDARRDLAPGLGGDLTARLAIERGDDPATLEEAAALWSLQRNLRILGIFHRLAHRDGKTRYMAFVPRVRGHILDAAAHPAARTVRPLVTRALGLDLVP